MRGFHHAFALRVCDITYKRNAAMHGTKSTKCNAQLTRKCGKRGHGPGGRLGHLRIGNGHGGSGRDWQTPSASGRCRRLLRRRRSPRMVARRRLVQRRHFISHLRLTMSIPARSDHGYNQRGIVASFKQGGRARFAFARNSTHVRFELVGELVQDTKWKYIGGCERRCDQTMAERPALRQ